jgi:hypothetical protein
MSEEGTVNDGRSSSSNTENILVSITAHDINIQFRGSLESVYKSTINFIVKQFPDINIAKKISLNYPVDYLVKKYSNLIRVLPDKGTVLVQLDRSGVEEEDDTTYKAEELDKHKNEEKLQESKSVRGSSDSILLKKKKKWSLKELIALRLIASRIANGLGITQEDEGLQIYEIEYATQANSKSVNSRLSEMIKSGYVIKDLKFDSTAGVGEGGREEKPSTIYTITTTGIHWLVESYDRQQSKKRINL